MGSSPETVRLSQRPSSSVYTRSPGVKVPEEAEVLQAFAEVDLLDAGHVEDQPVEVVSAQVHDTLAVPA